MAVRDVESSLDCAGKGEPGPTDRLGGIAVVLLGCALLLPGLGGYPLLDPTEGRHAAVARQMAQHHRWLVPLLYEEPYYDKPAPFYWLLRATAHLPLSPEAATRLPSAAATLLTALLLYRFARRRFGGNAALLGAVIFLTSPMVAALGRFGNQDALLSALVSAATVAWITWIDRPAGRPIAAYLAMGLGALVKGPIAILLPLLSAGACALRRGVLGDRLRQAALGRGLLLSCGILLAWLLPAALADPRYVSSFLLQHNFDRYVTGEVGHPKPIWFFLPALVAMLAPWSLALPAAVAAARRAAVERASANGAHLAAARPARAAPPVPEGIAEGDLLWWAFLIVGFFSLGQAKLATYALPAVAPIALWLGLQLARLASFPADASSTTCVRWLRGALATWAVLLAAVPIVAWLYVRRQFPSLAGAVPWTLVAPAAAIACLAIGWREPRRLRGTALALASTSVVLIGAVFLVGAPFASRVASDAQLARTASALAPGVPMVGFRIHPGSLSFYAGAPVRKMRVADDVARAAEGGPLLIVTRAGDVADLRAAGLHLYQWTPCERHCLFSTMPPPAGVPALPANTGGRTPS